LRRYRATTTALQNREKDKIMEADAANPPQSERVTRRRSLGSRGSENGNSSPATQSSNDHAPLNGAAAPDTIGIKSAMNDVAPTPNDSPEDTNNITGRPSRRIRPVSKHDHLAPKTLLSSIGHHGGDCMVSSAPHWFFNLFVP
jgi:hypothetical protein